MVSSTPIQYLQKAVLAFHTLVVCRHGEADLGETADVAIGVGQGTVPVAPRDPEDCTPAQCKGHSC
jgi:hypothetical protein